MSHPQDKSYRKYLGRHATSPSKDKEERQRESVTGDDLQVGSERWKRLAKTARSSVHPGTAQRGSLHRWHQRIIAR